MMNPQGSQHAQGNGHMMMNPQNPQGNGHMMMIPQHSQGNGHMMMIPQHTQGASQNMMSSSQSQGASQPMMNPQNTQGASQTMMRSPQSQGASQPMMNTQHAQGASQTMIRSPQSQGASPMMNPQHVQGASQNMMRSHQSQAAHPMMNTSQSHSSPQAMMGGPQHHGASQPMAQAQKRLCHDLTNDQFIAFAHSHMTPTQFMAFSQALAALLIPGPHMSHQPVQASYTSAMPSQMFHDGSASGSSEGSDGSTSHGNSPRQFQGPSTPGYAPGIPAQNTWSTPQRNMPQGQFQGHNQIMAHQQAAPQAVNQTMIPGQNPQPVLASSTTEPTDVPMDSAPYLGVVPPAGPRFQRGQSKQIGILKTFSDRNPLAPVVSPATRVTKNTPKPAPKMKMLPTRLTLPASPDSPESPDSPPHGPLQCRGSKGIRLGIIQVQHCSLSSSKDDFCSPSPPPPLFLQGG